MADIVIKLTSAESDALTMIIETGRGISIFRRSGIIGAIAPPKTPEEFVKLLIKSLASEQISRTKVATAKAEIAKKEAEKKLEEAKKEEEKVK